MIAGRSQPALARFCTTGGRHTAAGPRKVPGHGVARKGTAGRTQTVRRRDYDSLTQKALSSTAARKRAVRAAHANPVTPIPVSVNFSGKCMDIVDLHRSDPCSVAAHGIQSHACARRRPATIIAGRRLTLIVSYATILAAC